MRWSACMDEVVAWMVAAYPDEGCGLIVSADGRFRFQGCQNLAPKHLARSSYVLDPRELLLAEDRGEAVVVFVHSHPDGSDDFSADDRAEARMPDGAAAHPGVDYLVVSVTAGGARSAAAFRFEPVLRDFARVWAMALAA